MDREEIQNNIDEAVRVFRETLSETVDFLLVKEKK